MREQVNAHWLTLKTRWESLAEREQRTLRIGALVVTGAIIYLMWSGWLAHNNTLRSEIKTQQQTLVWMKSADKQIRELESHTHGGSKPLDNVMLLSYLQKQFQAGFDSESFQLKQSANGIYEMHFQKIPFDKFVMLLTKTLSEQPLSVAQFTVLADATPGIVNIDLILKSL